MKKIQISLCFIILMFSLSCNDVKERKKKSEIHDKQQINLVLKNLSKKYLTTCFLDSINYPYTLFYDSIVSNTTFQFINNFIINDIYKSDKDGWEHVSLYSDPCYYLDLSISEELLNLLLNTKPKTKIFHFFRHSSDSSNMILVIKLGSLKKFNHSITCNEESNVEIESSDNFYGKGMIVDVVKIRKDK